MRIHSGLSMIFWVDVVNIVYLINRGPSVPLELKLSREVLIGKEPKYSLLRTFAYIAYVRIDPEKNEKLDVEAVKCYFIGYGPDMFENKFWDDKNRKVVRHCDMTFHENIMYKDKEKKGSKTTKQMRVEVELFKDSPSYEQILKKLLTEELEVDQVTPEQVLRRSSRTIRIRR